MAFTHPSCPSSSSGSVERTHQSRDPEGCTYQSSDPEGYTYQSSDPEGCTYQSSDPRGCTYQSSDPGGCTYQPSDSEGYTYHKGELSTIKSAAEPENLSVNSLLPSRNGRSLRKLEMRERWGWSTAARPRDVTKSGWASADTVGRRAHGGVWLRETERGLEMGRPRRLNAGVMKPTKTEVETGTEVETRAEVKDGETAA
ncbi:NBS-LRR type resistance protein [Cucumis melo var. makuwa]|uniref:NBS-LRR type resistance protein n=1 Tax=Cucumis melo var. makuwa TaxID=1194695 RepID=A0A5D3CEY7_CUCMM|nr:NBS-LRR type resistance protein [Cucumis melo var. makuwa]